jgi:hypothetical protein
VTDNACFGPSSALACINNLNMFVVNTSSWGNWTGGVLGLSPDKTGMPPSVITALSNGNAISNAQATIVMNNFAKTGKMSSITFGGEPDPSDSTTVKGSYITHSIAKGSTEWTLAVSDFQIGGKS